MADTAHRQSKESRKKSNRKYRISSYGLTQEQFDLILTAQNYACGMCREPFEERQLIHVDHDHGCNIALVLTATSNVLPLRPYWSPAGRVFDLDDPFMLRAACRVTSGGSGFPGK